MNDFKKATTLKPAKTEREWWAMLKSKDTTFVRSMTDWEKIIADPRSNPLKGCTPEAVEHFTKSLVFENGGLGHADYGEVGKQLNYFQFSALWQTFGLSTGLFEDHAGYECAGRGTCHATLNSICTSNC
jgi:hypothetical protein